MVELGLNHEQQHQELLVMDALHLLSGHPFAPAMVQRPEEDDPDPVPLTWRAVEGGLYEIGHDGAGFAYDNESARHRVYLEPFEIAERAVTNEDWLAFIADGGYRRPELWLADGWAAVQASGWQARGYRQQQDGRWVAFGSHASDLVPGDANGVSDVFLRDMATGAVRLVSQPDGGTPADWHSAYYSELSVSADGRHVVFESAATNLVPGDTNGRSDVFVWDAAERP